MIAVHETAHPLMKTYHAQTYDPSRTFDSQEANDVGPQKVKEDVDIVTTLPVDLFLPSSAMILAPYFFSER